MSIDDVTASELEELDKALTAVVGAILQKPNRVAGTIVGVAASKLVAAGVMAGAFGAIGVFGFASTGTAIATLSGAAATTATLYWIGSSVGLGVAAGGAMLAGGALALGIPSAIYIRKKFFGRPRTEQGLNQTEQALLFAALRLATAARAVRLGGSHLGAEEKRLVVERGIIPLLSGLRKVYLPTEEEKSKCASQNASLAVWPRQRLRSAVGKLERLPKKWRVQ